MALVSRTIVVVFALLVSGVVAGIVVTIGVAVREWDDLAVSGNSGVVVWMATVFTIMVSSMAAVPALVAVAIAEALRLRSVLLHAGAGGLGLAALYYGLGYTDRGGSLPAGSEIEIMAGAGIAAAFVYWLIAGRSAGKWRETSTTPSSAHARESGHPGSLQD